MASPKAYSFKLRTLVTLILIISLTFFPCNSGGSVKKKMVMGSRPPGCFNKCFTCKPCKAALVIISPHRRRTSERDYEGYYLLAWKCKCGNKFFQP
ncbi:hypothetical protein QN277_026253 [Acacia crassicarpa]|uniref:Epidermal patterning factor-like protein n=1 Tax=Acacia crassicarpa TaxID=499986 RepID=A0AAE1J7A0_9FABA|nr:hypothetical protein QN277_026253 [Acacia crassicarpa]